MKNKKVYLNRKSDKKYWVYILFCADKTLYTGITLNVEEREKEHNGEVNSKKGAKYTQNRRPVKVVWKKISLNRSEAASEEWRIKKLKRKEKEDLIRGFVL